ncbi:hypothetical protein NDU88_006715 [Pleurodeles waltl]|uniref:Uncharacterized protein n=1 Tax=Pleurodeles waltl TaxID=8319 RepID=A0AAV7LTC7_PLEWA|nr:hypothetical protein NDU88_006715 [Pleurodeles waltl]
MASGTLDLSAPSRATSNHPEGRPPGPCGRTRGGGPPGAVRCTRWGPDSGVPRERSREPARRDSPRPRRSRGAAMAALPVPSSGAAGLPLVRPGVPVHRERAY